MAMPQFTRTLHFRISALFLCMLAVVAGGFYFWLNATIFTPDLAEDESNWYENLAEAELDQLAFELGTAWKSDSAREQLLVQYGEKIDLFEAEVIAFDPRGVNLSSSSPDSLMITVPVVDSTMLAEMSLAGWDYGSYPIPDDIGAYENRIFEVDRIFDPTSADSTVVGFLVASYRPLTIGIEQLEGEERAIGYQAILALLVYAGLCGLVIMAWMSRRIRNLSSGVQEFAGGDLKRRVASNSQDEIGALGRHFNTMAERIENMVDKLQQKELFQRQLIANISHDLRTPMASMKGYAETLTMQPDRLTDEDRDRYLSIISANLTHLDNLIDHMLTLSRFESGQAVFQMEAFPLAELVDSVMLRCEPLAEERGIALELDCDEPCEAMVNADPLQIAQVLQNLIENGIKFNRDGGQVNMRIEPTQGQRVSLTVSDTGLGISQQDLPHIFDRFYTADKSRQRKSTPGMASVRQHLGQSSGLGLAIAAKIVAGHDSELKATSELGKGTSFTFSLARAEENHAMEAEG